MTTVETNTAEQYLTKLCNMSIIHKSVALDNPNGMVWLCQNQEGKFELFSSNTPDKFPERIYKDDLKEQLNRKMDTLLKLRLMCNHIDEDV